MTQGTLWLEAFETLLSREEGSHSSCPRGGAVGPLRNSEWAGKESQELGHGSSPIPSRFPRSHAFQVWNSMVDKTEVLNKMSQEAKGKPGGAFDEVVMRLFLTP